MCVYAGTYACTSVLCKHKSTVYSHFTISSPDCALHTALAHVINVLGIVESHIPNVIGIHVRLHCFNALITSDYSVQCAFGTRNCEMTVSLH